MIDFESMETYLDNRKNLKYFIEKGCFITLEDMDKIKFLIDKYSKTEVMKCYKSDLITDETGRYGMPISVEVKCNYCSKIFIQKTSKTKFFGFFSKDKRPSPCPDCEEEKKRSDKENEYLHRLEINEIKNNNTESYIFNYLNPDKIWNPNIKIYDQWSYISNLNDRQYNVEDVEEFAKNMPYIDFLKTLYWKAISNKKKYDCDYRCQLCNNKGRLETHHRTYSILGAELRNMKELTVLCSDCHEKHHTSI